MDFNHIEAVKRAERMFKKRKKNVQRRAQYKSGYTYGKNVRPERTEGLEANDFQMAYHPFRNAFRESRSERFIMTWVALNKPYILRMLRAQTGRKWPEVYGMLCEFCGKNNLLRYQLECYLNLGLCLFDWAPDAETGQVLNRRNGEPITRRYPFYVHPQTGILQENVMTHRYRKGTTGRKKARFKQEKETLKAKIRNGVIRKKKHTRQPKLLVG